MIMKAFSIVELMIVVAVLGILAAIVVPKLPSYATEAKTAAARSNLRVLRCAIELYASQHRGVPPGYPNNDPMASPTSLEFYRQLAVERNYIRKISDNPFNGKNTLLIIGNNGAFPAEARGTYGWIYQPATKTIRLDWPGVDNEGIRYYDY